MPNNATPLTIALLAAGGSRRFNGVKLAQPLVAGGQAIIVDTYQKLKRVAASCAPHCDVNLVVILGGHQSELQKLLPQAAECVINPNWQAGLSTSVQCAANYADQRSSALMLTLADQVALTEADLQQLITLWLQERQQPPAPTVAAYYLDEPGVPAIFNNCDLAPFSKISGDRGAKPLLIQHKMAGRLRQLPLPQAAIDIDTAADLESWQKTR